MLNTVNSKIQDAFGYRRALYWKVYGKCFLTATEFFMSATAEVNSGNCNSGEYTKGKLRSPETFPACLQNSSMFSSLVKWAA